MPEPFAPGPPLLPRDNCYAPDMGGCAIVQHNVSRSIQHDDTHREGFENSLQEPLTGSDLLLAAQAVGSVARDSEHAHSRPGRIAGPVQPAAPGALAIAGLPFAGPSRAVAAAAPQ